MYKMAFPILIFARGKFYLGGGGRGYFPGGNSTTGKLRSHFSGVNSSSGKS